MVALQCTATHAYKTQAVFTDLTTDVQHLVNMLQTEKAQPNTKMLVVSQRTTGDFISHNHNNK